MVAATGPPGHLFLDHLPPVGLTGTKYACGRGGCGACTVMVSKCDPVSKKIRYPAQKPRARGGFCFFVKLVFLSRSQGRSPRTSQSHNFTISET